MLLLFVAGGDSKEVWFAANLGKMAPVSQTEYFFSDLLAIAISRRIQHHLLGIDFYLLRAIYLEYLYFNDRQL